MYNILHKNMTLGDDFGAWWDLPKYRGVDIEAKKFSHVRIVRRHASYKRWPGADRDVEYAADSTGCFSKRCDAFNGRTNYRGAMARGLMLQSC